MTWRDKPTTHYRYGLAAIDPSCPIHGDGAKKDCICEDPSAYQGRNINCPIHLWKQPAPQDSLDEILVRVAHDTITHDGAKSAIQDWHITQVREFVSRAKKEIPSDTTYNVYQGSKEQRSYSSKKVHDYLDRALERLEDKA